MAVGRCVITNRVFLLGLDEIYRTLMKPQEQFELLACAQDTAAVLSVAPADVPVEGYYTENERLTEYFRLMRALQMVEKADGERVQDRRGFRRLKEVTGSGMFGPVADDSEMLLPGGRDPLTAALKAIFPNWTIKAVTRAAREVALKSDDFSLVAMAALSSDAVVIAALRETTVLYAELEGGAAFAPRREFVWKVDKLICEKAERFIQTFNGLFSQKIPDASPENAELYWEAHYASQIAGRCVRIGFDDSVRQTRYYHWAIDVCDGEFVVKDFWDTDLWTTARYREQLENRLFR